MMKSSRPTHTGTVSDFKPLIHLPRHDFLLSTLSPQFFLCCRTLAITPMPSGITLSLSVTPSAPSKPGTSLLYHAITRKKKQEGCSGWLLPQVAVSIPTAIKHLLPYFSGFSSPGLWEGEILMLSRNSCFRKQRKVLNMPCALYIF